MAVAPAAATGAYGPKRAARKGVRTRVASSLNMLESRATAARDVAKDVPKALSFRPAIRTEDNE